jgi:hypothetical protein
MSHSLDPSTWTKRDHHNHSLSAYSTPGSNHNPSNGSFSWSTAGWTKSIFVHILVEGRMFTCSSICGAKCWRSSLHWMSTAFELIDLDTTHDWKEYLFNPKSTTLEINKRSISIYFVWGGMRRFWWGSCRGDEWLKSLQCRTQARSMV